MTTMTDRCDCPYPDPMTYGGPNHLCPEHGDVDAILARGRYTDRRGRVWMRGLVDWWHVPSDRTLTPDEMRLLIVRDLHRDECPGLALCEWHPAPQVWKEGHSWFLETGWEVIECPALGAALDAARHMTGATP